MIDGMKISLTLIDFNRYCLLNQRRYLLILLFLKEMEQDPRPSKEILLIILQKCRSALPQVATLMKRLQKIPAQQQKVKKKDCLNPKFLLQLSKCGQQIRQILQKAIQQQKMQKSPLKKYLQQYMDVIYAIRQYHQQAHRTHDLHKNSTEMKESLLRQLKNQTDLSRVYERQIESLKIAIREKDNRIRELQLRSGDPNNLNLSSEFSKIQQLRTQRKYGQLYGGESKVGQLEEDLTPIEGKRLRQRIVELEQILQEKQMLLQDKQEEYQQTVEQLKLQILQLQKNVKELYPQQQKQVKKSSFKQFKQVAPTAPNSREGIDSQQMLRYLLIQAVTIEQYIKQSYQ